MLSSEMEQRFTTFVLQQIFGNEQLSRPVYCAEITSEEDADQLADSLPLIYIWNEKWPVGTFTISLNGDLLGYLMEAVIPRENASFKRVFDAVTDAVTSSVSGAVLNTCKRTGLPPSVLFAGV